MIESLFQPTVVVKDDGTIDVDWGQSYVNSVDTDTQKEVYDDPHHHADVIDTVLGDASVSPADKLRRLADHLDGGQHVYVVAWSGGYEEASYASKPDEASAREQFESWKGDAKIDQGDSVDLLRVNLSTMAVEALERV